MIPKFESAIKDVNDLEVKLRGHRLMEDAGSWATIQLLLKTIRLQLVIRAREEYELDITDGEGGTNDPEEYQRYLEARSKFDEWSKNVI